MANSLVSIQIIPSVPGKEDIYGYVDAAISIIEQAGVSYEVHPLETTMEGDMADLMTVIQKMNDQMTSMGADSVISQIKVLHQPGGITAESLTEKYR